MNHSDGRKKKMQCSMSGEMEAVNGPEDFQHSEPIRKILLVLQQHDTAWSKGVRAFKR